MEPAVRAVFFDVDFTLIYPGPAFQGVGYRQSCERHGIAVDEARYDAAVREALASLDHEQVVYDDEIFIRYTRRIIEGMGGTPAKRAGRLRPRDVRGVGRLPPLPSLRRLPRRCCASWRRGSSRSA